MSRMGGTGRGRRLLVRLAVLAAPVWLAVGVGGSVEPAAAATADPAASDQVIVFGVPGLRWRDVTPSTMPVLWKLVGESATGQMSVRSTRSRTCPVDGWVQLGTGNRARYPSVEGAEPGTCPEIPKTLPRDEGGATVDGWAAVVAENRRLAFGTEVGLLGTEIRHQVTGSTACTAAAGPGAAMGAANQAGSVDLWVADPQVLTEQDLATCALTVVAAPPPDLERPAGELRRADELLAHIQQLRPPGSLLLVLGLSDLPGERSQLHVALANGPGFAGGELVSASTRRAPFVQLSDAAPTVLDQLGLSIPAAMPYRPMRATGSGSGIAQRLEHFDDLARQADVQGALTPPFFLVVVVSQALLYAWVYVALRRHPVARDRARLLRWAHVLAVTYAAAPVATYLANLVPWWNAGHPLPALLLSASAAGATITAVGFAGPWRRHPFGPAGAVAVITAVVLALDVMTGARLQLSSLAGYSPVVAGRFAGYGNLAFAIFGTSALLAAAALASERGRRAAGWIAVVTGAAAVVVDGAPAFGSDFGGVIALVPAFATLWLLVTDRHLSWRRLLVLVAAGVVVVTAIAVSDYLRPEDSRTHLGRFVADVLDGTAGTVVQRKVEANLSLLTNSVLTLMVPLALLFLVFLLRRPSGLLLRTFRQVPTLEAGLLSVLVLGVVGGVVNDSGIAIPAMAATVAIPVAVAVVARSLQLDDQPVWPAGPEMEPARVAEPGDRTG